MSDAESAGGQMIARAAAVVLLASTLVGAGRMTLQAAYFYDNHSLTAIADRVVPARWRVDFQRGLRPETLPMMHFVRASLNKGDLYVVPPELERFRLVAGAPALADFKSHPYKDVEVLEWRRRLDLVAAAYASRGACASIDAIRAAYPITHVVADERIRPLSCPGWTKTYADPIFAIYQLQRTVDGKIESTSR